MKTIRFGLIGFGGWGSHHAQAIADTPGAELAAIAVRSEESRDRARQSHPGVPVHADYRRLLEREELDIVDVVLPSHLHAEVGQAALESGRHLLMEKPMAITSDECRRLNRVAAQRGLLLAVGFELRLSELWSRVRQLIGEGAVGRPQYALIELWRRPYRLGSEGWRYDIDRVGNWILEEPIHFFDLARWYFEGEGDPVWIDASASSRQEGHPELQDNFSALLGFAGGGHAVITQTLSAFQHHQTVKVTGTAGAVWASWSGTMDRDLRPSSSLQYFDGKDLREVALSRPTGEVFELRDQIARVADAVRDVGRPPADGRDGLWSVALCEAAQLSIRQGGRISIQPPADSH